MVGGGALLAALASGTGTAALILLLARRPGASAALGVTGAYAGAGAFLAREGLVRLREAGPPLPDVPVEDEPVQNASNEPVENAKQDLGSAKRPPSRQRSRRPQVGSEVATAADRAPEAGVKVTEFSASRLPYAAGPQAPASILRASRPPEGRRAARAKTGRALAADGAEADATPVPLGAAGIPGRRRCPSEPRSRRAKRAERSERAGRRTGDDGSPGTTAPGPSPTGSPPLFGLQKLLQPLVGPASPVGRQRIRRPVRSVRVHGALDGAGDFDTRETSSLRKMFRMCVSTVLGLRNSVSAISGLVLRSTTSRATWPSRSVSASTPIAPIWPGRVRRCTRRPSRRSSCSAASRYRVLRRHELRGGVLELSHRPLGFPACASARPASARESAASTGGPTSSAAAAEASARSAAMRHGRRRARRPRRRDRPSRSPCGAAHRGCDRFRAAAAPSASSGRPSANQQRVSSSSHFAHQPPGMSGISAPRTVEEGSTAETRVASLEARGGKSQPGCRRDEAVVHSAGELHALLGRTHSDLDIACRERREGAIAENTGEACTLPDNRAPSTASSSSSAASAARRATT